MVERGIRWINVVAGIFGAVALVLGVISLTHRISVGATFLAVLGFLIAGWAVFDHRRFRRGTPESELDGGRTIE